MKTKDGRSFVVADLPGLIEGASLGEGLGDKFLKHIERTRVIAHIIDMGCVEGRNPIEDYKIINQELKNFNEKMMEKPQIVIANKMDVVGAEENLKQFQKEIHVPVYPISALMSKDIDKVLIALADLLENIPKQPLYEDGKFESHVLYKFKEEAPFSIQNAGNGVWVVSGEKVEKLLRMTKFNTEESALRFATKLRKMGIDDELRNLGAVEGDTIRILDLEFEYKE